ncbi:unnamed protein product [Caretta caretta]
MACDKSTAERSPFDSSTPSEREAQAQSMGECQQMNEFCISCGKCRVKQHSKGSTGEIKEQNYIFDHGVWRGGKRI